MSEKRDGTLLQGVAKKIGSTLGVIVAEASKVVRPLSTKRSSVQGTKSRPHRTRRKSSSSSTHPVNRKRKRAMPRGK
jgi:hypothetical protein